MAKENTKQEMTLVSSTDFPAEKVALIRSLVAPKANKEELELFLYQCNRTGLDPLVRQIYAIHRWNSQQGRETMTIQTSIDGFRVIAERSGVYAGQSEPEFVEENGKLVLCKIRVYKFHPVTHIKYEAAVGVAYWNEYVQTNKENKPSGLWAKMPHVMLSKVAEAVALRKCFPQDLSGVYTADEIETEDVTPIEVTTQPNPQATSQPPANEPPPPPFNADQFAALEKEVNLKVSVDDLNALYARENVGNKIKNYPPALALFTERKKELTTQPQTQN